MLWGCISGVGTLTSFKGNINSEKYIKVLENNLWTIIVRHFPHGNYVFHDDYVPVHISRLTGTYMEENDINTSTWPVSRYQFN